MLKVLVVANSKLCFIKQLTGIPELVTSDVVAVAIVPGVDDLLMKL